MRIGLAYNQKPDPANSAEEPPSTNDAFAEWDDPSTIAAVEQALGLFGSVIRLEADPLFPQQVALARPDLVFNMAEGLSGNNGSASSRMTLPKRPRACSTAAMVDGSSHSANASLALSDAASGAGSGFSLYARPIRMWSRVTSYKK